MNQPSHFEHFAEEPEADMDLQVYDPYGLLGDDLEEEDLFPDSFPFEQENPLAEVFPGFAQSTAEQLKPVLGKKIVGVEVRGGETEFQTPEYVFHLESDRGDWIEFSISYLLQPSENGTDFFLKLNVQTVWGFPPPQGVFNKVK